MNKPKKRLLILSGISGAGKSTYAKSHLHDFIFSADEWFMGPKGYKFDASQLSRAHLECFRAALIWAKDPYYQGTAFIDNTNLSAWEVSPYVMLAEAHNIYVEIHRLACDLDVALKRGVHDVPERTLHQQHKRFLSKDLLPWWRVIDVQ